MNTRLKVPFEAGAVENLRSGEQVLLTGTLYTGRDAAHKRMVEQLEKYGSLPIGLKGQVIYYVGPTPNKPDAIIGSAGPTTSSRMDAYASKLMEKGLKGMIGKGYRSEEIVASIKKHSAVYMAAIGGTGALLAQKIISSEVVAYEDLGTEAIRKLEVVDFPCIVINDSHGNDWYKEAHKQFGESSNQ
ncbi:Fe-S-containing hydro-lyase [Salinicoccus sesuvii]|uniref:Fe-S-containing hydro-lyase n=1 Tax=Salinicoccus sesuvii TaxID=868281 RepID=A0ABV7N484_9STAP